ncbi:MAG TPA: Dyp-type peroxidase [Pyrinomonadaceae bacterium]|nr:Dyp-type peroxidase [Pyrinomonadaceae bacterium]
MSTLDLKDVQGIIARGYGELEFGCYLLLNVRDAKAAREWLGTISGLVTSGEERRPPRALNIAFTCRGLEALGLDAEILQTFSHEFQDGMTSDYRQRILGDHGESAPERWDWGGPNTAPVHILLMLFAADEDARLEFCRTLSQGFKASGGVEQVGETLRSIVLRDEATGCSKEHFGFCDSITQPFIEGLGKTGPPANSVRTGEFVLGYPNEYNLFTERPVLKAERDPQNILPPEHEGSGQHDLGMNGTYLVFRQLQQHVNRFWQFMEDSTRAPGGQSHPDARIRLASKMVGRWPSGAPLVLSPDAENPALGKENDFAYHAVDPHGLKCPIGSHIRRSNPRDSLDPHPGTPESIEVNKRHQLLRRGRAYGQPVAASMNPEDILRADASGERGLHFICLNANISRQFEFVQQTWINNPKFGGLYNDADPVVGDRDAGQKGESAVFTEQAEPVRRRVERLPQFVTVRGGAYFFLPGLRAIRYLASI